MIPDVTYALSYLVIVFTVYAVGGWLWETAFCSIVSHGFQRRGMLYGPACPIYGFGAIVVYYPLLPIDDPLTLFVVGTALCTAVEGATGVAVDYMFGRRFWDYTRMPLNWRGYVCLPASLLFGGFALIVRYGTQPLLEPAIASLPHGTVGMAALVLAAAYVTDTCCSVQRWDGGASSRIPATVRRLTSEVSERVVTPSEIRDAATALAEEALDRTGEWRRRAGVPRLPVSEMPIEALGRIAAHAGDIRVNAIEMLGDARMRVTATRPGTESVIQLVRERMPWGRDVDVPVTMRFPRSWHGAEGGGGVADGDAGGARGEDPRD